MLSMMLVICRLFEATTSVDCCVMMTGTRVTELSAVTTTGAAGAAGLLLRLF